MAFLRGKWLVVLCKSEDNTYKTQGNNWAEELEGRKDLVCWSQRLMWLQLWWARNLTGSDEAGKHILATFIMVYLILSSKKALLCCT